MMGLYIQCPIITMLSIKTLRHLLYANKNIYTALSVNRRGIRSYQRIKRTVLPQYKRTLNELPQSDYLDNNDGIDNLADLWSKKLNAYKIYLPMTYVPKPVLLEAMYDSNNDIEASLRIIQDNLTTMTSFYIGNSFEVLHDQVLYNEEYKCTVLSAPEFRALCGKALYKMRFLEADELLKVSKCLSILGIQEDTLIVQSTLQMIRHSINDFSYNELKDLEYHLEKFDDLRKTHTSLLAILKESIPLAQRKLRERGLVPDLLLDKCDTTNQIGTN